GVHERAVGFWQRLPAVYSLGFYNGKAPFTVTFDDSRLNEEMLWDVGDGSPRIKARNATHTFKTAGRFKIVAEKEPWAKRLRTHMDEPGEGLYFGEAEIAEAAAPTATVQYVDDTHLLVEFDQRMQAKDAAVSLAGGIKVAKWA